VSTSFPRPLVGRLIAVIVSVAATAAAQFTPVPCTVSNGSSQARVQEPVTFGFPVPETPAIATLGQFRVLDANLQPVPAQFRALTRWNGVRDATTLPLRWVQASFNADVPAYSAATYVIGYGGPAPAGSLVVTSNATMYSVTPVAGTVIKVAKNVFSLFNSATIGGQPILSGAGSLDMVDANGAPVVATGVQTALEQSGPVYAVIRQNGVLGDLAYTCRWHFAAGRRDVAVEFRLENPQAYGLFATTVLDGEVHFDKLFLNLTVGGSSPTVTSATGQRNVTTSTPYELRQDFAWTAVPTDVLGGFWFTETQGSATVGSGGRYSGAVDVSTAAGGVTVAMDRFWQNFPKSMKVSGGKARIGLFPEWGSGPHFGGQYANPQVPGIPDPIAAANYRFEGGRWKTHRMVFDFHDGGPRNAAAVSAAAERANTPLAGCPSPTKVRESWATGLLFVENRNDWENESFSRYERFAEMMGDDAAADFVPNYGRIGLNKFLARGGTFGGQQPYGWENFGDLPWAEGYCDLHYDWAGSMMLAFLKSGGNYGIFDRARDMAAFRRDYGQNHSKDPGEIWRGAQFYEKGWWHGNYVAGQNSHNWILGLCLHYVLSGDEASREAALENIDFLLRDPPQNWNGMWGSRIPGWQIDNLVNAHNLIGHPTALIEAGLGVGNFEQHELAGGGLGYHLNPATNPPSTDPWMDNIFFIGAAKYVIASKTTNYLPFLGRMRTWFKNTCITMPSGPFGAIRLPDVYYLWAPGAPGTKSVHLSWPMIEALSYSAVIQNDPSDLFYAAVLFESATRYWQCGAGTIVNAYDPASWSWISFRPLGFPNSESKALGNVMQWGGAHMAVRAYFEGEL
jgi:hypothetical protein